MDKEVFYFSLRFSDVLKRLEDDFSDVTIRQNDLDGLDEDDYGRYRDAYLQEFPITLVFKKMEFNIDFTERKKDIVVDMYEPKPWSPSQNRSAKKEGGLERTFVFHPFSYEKDIFEQLSNWFITLEKMYDDPGLVAFHLLSDQKKLPYPKKLYEVLKQHVSVEKIIQQSQSKKVEVIHFHEEEICGEEKKQHVFVMEFVPNSCYLLYNKGTIDIFSDAKKAEKAFLDASVERTKEIYQEKIKETFK